MDALANGRKFRTVNLKDDCTRECPAIDVALSIPGSRVVEMLERVARERGYPDVRSRPLTMGLNYEAARLMAGQMITACSSTSSTRASRPRTPTSKVSTAGFAKNA